MSQIDPSKFRDNAVDLSAVAAAAEAERSKREAAALREAEKVAESWDKNMKRAFKGIMPRATRHAFLMAGARRAERAA